MFSTPKMPEAPKPVVSYSASADISRYVEQDRVNKAKRKGRAANVLAMDYLGTQRASDILGA